MFVPFLNACGGAVNKSAYYKDYQESLVATSASAVKDNKIDAFALIFANLQNDELIQLVDGLYADEFYFNDTFRTLREKQALTQYLLETGKSVDKLNITIDDIARSGNEIYVRWSMNIQFTVLGKPINSDSVGITHLRFNDTGQIILHQDFWDGADAFYQYLPFIGIGLRQIRGRL